MDSVPVCFRLSSPSVLLLFSSTVVSDCSSLPYCLPDFGDKRIRVGFTTVTSIYVWISIVNCRCSLLICDARGNKLIGMQDKHFIGVDSSTVEIFFDQRLLYYPIQILAENCSVFKFSHSLYMVFHLPISSRFYVPRAVLIGRVNLSISLFFGLSILLRHWCFILEPSG